MPLLALYRLTDPRPRPLHWGVGSSVVLRRGRDAYVFLTHLQHESVQVAPGDSVSTGWRFAAIGNSGHRWEPHLHLSAQRSVGAATVLDADPRPMTFDGRFPIRNDVIRSSSD